MKRKVCILVWMMLVCCAVMAGCAGQKAASGNEAAKEALYKDGTYEGKSEATGEGYYGTAKITVKGGRISSVDFRIIDGSGLVFDEKYGPTMFAGNDEYLEQCKNDLEGIRQYKGKLVETQDADKVDVISGATWSNGIFRETVKNALANAGK